MSKKFFVGLVSVPILAIPLCVVFIGGPMAAWVWQAGSVVWMLGWFALWGFV